MIIFHFLVNETDFICYYREVVERTNMQKCWNWQTGKTKDLVLVTTCGFKSHLLHYKKRARPLRLSPFCFICRGGPRTHGFEGLLGIIASSVRSVGKRSTGPFSFSTSPHLPQDYFS